MNKTLMTALCALSVAGFAMTSEAAPRHHRESPTKTFQRDMAHVGADLIHDAGHALIGAAFGTPAPAVVPVAVVGQGRRMRFL